MDYWTREASRWLQDALDDFSVAKILLESGHCSASCFHSQQAAEKAVKASLYQNRVEARGHSILELLENLERTTSSKFEHLHARMHAYWINTMPLPDTQTCIQAFLSQLTSYIRRRMRKDASNQRRK